MTIDGTKVSRALVRMLLTLFALSAAPALAQTVVTSGDVKVATADRVIVLKKIAPGPTRVELPSVIAFTGTAIEIYDWAGNAGPMTFVPYKHETIMGFPRWVAVNGGLRLIPVNAGGIRGWAVY
jgi:hypothetical protein